ncbi:MAG TPA: alanine racemase [Lachnospiraceae bacterium]|nr:alanine racemase [Lachnospiraceae bacterium]
MSIRRIAAEVSLKAICDNMESIHNTLKKDTAILAVIKANGYGHGALRIAEALDDKEYVFGYALATAEEALELRRNGIKKEILILGYTYPEDYEKLIQNDISLTVFKTETAISLSEAAKKLGKNVKLHIKLDTGMSRIGFNTEKESLNEIKRISELPNIDIEGIFTHFSRADEGDKSFAYEQLRSFNDFCGELDKLVYIKYKHCANSAAILELPEADTGLVRAGVIIYGLKPSEEVDIGKYGLKPAITIKSSIVLIKEVPENTPVSYGGTFVTTRRTRIATIPAGYADGYPRSLSNRGEVLIRGKRAPVIGRVCMDQLMVDVTDIKAREFDEVVLLGSQGDGCITAEELGELSGRFNYELVCDISERVPRIYTRT